MEREVKLEILSDLVELKRPLGLIQNDLKKLEWDSDQELKIVTQNQLIKNIKYFINNPEGMELMEQWADLVECREDLGFENERTKEAIHNMANPVLSGLRTKNNLQKLLFDLD